MPNLKMRENERLGCHPGLLSFMKTNYPSRKALTLSHLMTIKNVQGQGNLSFHFIQQTLIGVDIHMSKKDNLTPNLIKKKDLVLQFLKQSRERKRVLQFAVVLFGAFTNKFLL